MIEGSAKKVPKPQNRAKKISKLQYRIEIYRDTETAVTDVKAAVVNSYSPSIH